MLIFTCHKDKKSRSKSQSPERRVPVISAPFNFRHENAEMKSVFEALSNQLPGTSAYQRDLNSLATPSISTMATTYNDRSTSNLNTPLSVSPLMFKEKYEGNANTFVSPNAIKGLRSALSSPELRGDAYGNLNSFLNLQDTSNANVNVNNNPPFRPVRSGAGDGNSETRSVSRRKSWFSVNTDIVENKPTILRRMLDTIGCTQADQFDIQDFQRVKPYNATAEVHRTTNAQAYARPANVLNPVVDQVPVSIQASRPIVPVNVNTNVHAQAYTQFPTSANGTLNPVVVDQVPVQAQVPVQIKAPRSITPILNVNANLNTHPEAYIANNVNGMNIDQLRVPVQISRSTVSMNVSNGNNGHSQVYSHVTNANVTNTVDQAQVHVQIPVPRSRSAAPRTMYLNANTHLTDVTNLNTVNQGQAPVRRSRSTVSANIDANANANVTTKAFAHGTDANGTNAADWIHVRGHRRSRSVAHIDFDVKAALQGVVPPPSQAAVPPVPAIPSIYNKANRKKTNRSHSSHRKPVPKM